MKIYMTGFHGFIGTSVAEALGRLGHEVVALPRMHSIWPRFEGQYAIINLAGKNIFTRFSSSAKAQLYASRIETTRSIIRAIQLSGVAPVAVVSASAVGYYGDGGNRLLTEDSPGGGDFLARMCADWEAGILNFCAAEGIRCVVLRTGFVLGRGGGMLKVLVPLFQSGLGARLGTGEQYVPWISLEDITRAYVFAVSGNSLSGPVNAVCGSVTNAEFTRVLAGAVHRPAVFSVPKRFLQFFLGELGSSILFSQRISNKKLTQAGFAFSVDSLQGCLQEVVHGHS